MSSTELLQGQKVVVIGGSSGVGRSIAIAALAHGASVVIASSSSDKVDSAIELLKQAPKGELNAFVSGQVLDIEDTSALIAFLSQEGPFDHLAITAGKMPGAMRFPQDDISKEFKGAFDNRYWPVITADLSTQLSIYSRITLFGQVVQLQRQLAPPSNALFRAGR
ncbi:hypothetical protein RSOLAG22IIIB_04844 [Rhizoctonia solani]|uniref:Uncharacterized protein n=1 Tax=Rhizoctonia solani TaxID=456999 RepID=A0A0K6G0E0_9AGAM|nr:hypothetical protein RSOLAG22IIIB_04844 [Rhizoctonia solani]